MLPAVAGASQLACVSKHWNSLPCGSVPLGTCSAVHAQLLSGAVGSHKEPKASAMPLPHHVRSSAQQLASGSAPQSPHGFSASASQALCEP